MKYLKLGGLAVIAVVALMALAGTASATTLTGSGGTTLGAGTTVHEVSEETVFDAATGKITCKRTTRHWVTGNAGGSGVDVSGNVDSLSFTECNATVTVLKAGSLTIHGTSGNNGTLSSSGTEVTMEFLGTHCIFTTSNTSLGTVTGSATTGGNATVDISATIPRTGGRSGAFCGSSAQLTGSYSITSPSVLNIDA